MINKLICFIFGHTYTYEKDPHADPSGVFEYLFKTGWYDRCPRCGKELSKLK